jgi:ABC-2 type transport system ATP-binding protein
MIRVACARKTFGPVVAVEDVSLDVRPGETFGLLGPNGAGKTTTIQLIAGVLKPDRGEFVLDGQRDPTRPETRRRLGVAPQAESLYGDMSADENLTFFGRLYGLSGARLRQRVEGCLELAGLAERRRDRVDTFSGGMKQRLNLACALVHDPPILIFDEPTAGVDPQARNHLLESIERLAQAGKTILYTTHYMEEAQRLCDRVAIMDRGKILAVDAVETLLAVHGGPARIEATLAEVPAVELPGTRRERSWSMHSEKPFEDLARLVDAGVRFLDFRVERPNLETVFLNLTERSLRD